MTDTLQDAIYAALLKAKEGAERAFLHGEDKRANSCHAAVSSLSQAFKIITENPPHQ